MRHFFILSTGIFLVSCAQLSTEYITFEDPAFLYDSQIPFELALPKNVIIDISGPQLDEEGSALIIYNHDRAKDFRAGTFENYFYFSIDSYHQDSVISLEKYCTDMPVLPNRQDLKVKYFKKISSYELKKVELNCWPQDLYFIFDSDSLYVIRPGREVRSFGIKAIDYAVDHIRFLPENETVKKEEEKRKEREEN